MNNNLPKTIYRVHADYWGLELFEYCPVFVLATTKYKAKVAYIQAIKDRNYDIFGVESHNSAKWKGLSEVEPYHVRVYTENDYIHEHYINNITVASSELIAEGELYWHQELDISPILEA